MADHLLLSDQALHALASGEEIVAFAARHVVDLNDELQLVAGGPRQTGEPSSEPAGTSPLPNLPPSLVGLVVGLQPAASLAGSPGKPFHVPAGMQDGDAVILRVFVGDAPVLPDGEFEARRTAVEAMFA